MTYNTIKESYGRKETVTDVQSFARDLSKALGGGPIIPNNEGHDNSYFASFMLGTDLISMTGNRYGSKGRIEVRISAPDVKHDDCNHYDKTHNTQTATVSPDARTIERIACDIRKRVIDASQEALKLQRAYAAQKNSQRNGISEHMEALKAAMPALRVTRQSERDLSASIYGGGESAYVSATLNAGGTVSISHITSMSLEQFVQVMKVLNGR
jgi:hypothetical protein